MMNWGWGFGWGEMLVMMLVMFVVVGGLGALVALVIWALVRSSRSGSGGLPNAPSRALEVLKERYARGEITREQYEQMRQDLMRGGGSAPSGA